MKQGKNLKNIDSYIKGFPKEIAERLLLLKSITKKVAPKAEETISYGMPAFKIGTSTFIYFSGYKNHVSLYPFPSTIKAFQKESKEYKTSKGTIQFQHDEKLPLNLITKIIKFRLKELISKIGKKK